MNLTAIPNERATSGKITSRACKLSQVACGSNCPDCAAGCNPSHSEAFWENDGSATSASGKSLPLKLLGTLLIGGTFAFLGLGQIGAMFWLFELVASVFVGFIPGLLLL